MMNKNEMIEAIKQKRPRLYSALKGFKTAKKDTVEFFYNDTMKMEEAKTSSAQESD